MLDKMAEKVADADVISFEGLSSRGEGKLKYYKIKREAESLMRGLDSWNYITLWRQQAS